MAIDFISSLFGVSPPSIQLVQIYQMVKIAPAITTVRLFYED
jgi:hypothetical protein